MGKLHFGLQARQALKLLTQPRCLLTNHAMSFVKCARAARRSHAKRMTVCSKLSVKMADLRHIDLFGSSANCIFSRTVFFFLFFSCIERKPLYFSFQLCVYLNKFSFNSLKISTKY